MRILGRNRRGVQSHVVRLARYLQTGDLVAGSSDPWSAGNGSLMRLAPVALRFRHDRPRLLAAAAD